MLNIEIRQQYRSIGLIDDFVLNGFPNDYLSFAEIVDIAIKDKKNAMLNTNSSCRIEIILDKERDDLFTSLQNENNEYFSDSDWQNRDILRIIGNEDILSQLRLFLIDLSGRGEGYSYISEYSETSRYSLYSPEWRLHVNV